MLRTRRSRGCARSRTWTASPFWTTSEAPDLSRQLLLGTAVGGPGGRRRPQHLYSGERRPAQAQPFSLGPAEPTRTGPRFGAGGVSAGPVEQLLDRKTLRFRTYDLERGQGRPSADDSWKPVEHHALFPERAEYEAAAARRPEAVRAWQRAGALSPSGAAAWAPVRTPPTPPPAQPLPGWVVVAAGAPVLGPLILYWWPDEGWQLERVRRRSRNSNFSHVATVGYRQPERGLFW